MGRAFRELVEEVEKGLEGKDFKTWRSEIMTELTAVDKIIQAYQVEHEPEEMRYQMRGLAGWVGRMPAMLAAARYYRSDAQRTKMNEFIQKNFSPNVLRDMVKASCLEEQRMEDILDGMSDSLIEICGMMRTDISYAKKTSEHTGGD